MAVLKYRDGDGNYQSLVGLNVQNQVVQTTGQSTTAVMSQKAVSDLVPAQASASNQLADKDFVNSSITTATATYQGSYNLVSDLSLTTQASHGQIEDALGTAISGADNNDYAFVQIPTADATPTEIASVERYKFNGTRWSYEYAINNSGFTAAQWAAVNSGITSGLVAKLGQLTGNTYSAQNGLAGLFGIDNNGAWQNIVPSDLASVLSASLDAAGHKRLRWKEKTDNTDGNGTISCSFDTQVIILAAFSVQGGLYIIPGAKYNNQYEWNLLVLNGMTPYADSSVTIQIIYYNA